jgi:hypothetical protein
LQLANLLHVKPYSFDSFHERAYYDYEWLLRRLASVVCDFFVFCMITCITRCTTGFVQKKIGMGYPGSLCSNVDFYQRIMFVWLYDA